MMVNPVVHGYTKILNHWKIFRKLQKKQQPTENQKILKPKYKLSGVRFHILSCPSAYGQLRHWLWYILFTCRKLSQHNFNKTRAGGVASFIGEPARCL